MKIPESGILKSMRILFRRTFEDDDTMILISGNETEAKLLMKLGQMEAKIVGRTPPGKDNYTMTDGHTGEVHRETRAQLQVLFQSK